MSDFYVDPVYGLDTNPGTNTEPFQTFHKAMTSGFGAPTSETDTHYVYSGQVEATINIYLKGGTCPVSKGYLFDLAPLVPDSMSLTTSVTIKGTANSILLLDNDFFITSDYFIKQETESYYFDPHMCQTIAHWAMENIVFVNLSSSDIKFFYGNDVMTSPCYDGINSFQAKNCSFRGVGELCKGLITEATATATISVVNCSVANPCTPSTLINAANEFTVTQLKNSVGTTYVEIVNGIAKAKSSESIIGNGAFLPINSGNYSTDPLFISNGWIDDASYLDGRPVIAEDSIGILSGDSCRVLSPVFNYPDTLLSSAVYVKATEDLSGGAGHNQVVDSTPLTIDRTIEVRFSDTIFAQSDLTPTWNTISRGVCDSIQGKYVQFRVTLITNGA